MINIQSTWRCIAVAKSLESSALHNWMSFDETFGDMSPLFSFENNAPIFLELSSISRFFAWVACDPPRALDVSSNSLVSVPITGLSSAANRTRVLDIWWTSYQITRRQEKIFLQTKNRTSETRWSNRKRWMPCMCIRHTRHFCRISCLHSRRRCRRSWLCLYLRRTWWLYRTQTWPRSKALIVWWHKPGSWVGGSRMGKHLVGDSSW